MSVGYRYTESPIAITIPGEFHFHPQDIPGDPAIGAPESVSITVTVHGLSQNNGSIRIWAFNPLYGISENGTDSNGDISIHFALQQQPEDPTKYYVIGWGEYVYFPGGFWSDGIGFIYTYLPEAPGISFDVDMFVYGTLDYTSLDTNLDDSVTDVKIEPPLTMDEEGKPELTISWTYDGDESPDGFFINEDGVPIGSVPSTVTSFVVTNPTDPASYTVIPYKLSPAGKAPPSDPPVTIGELGFTKVSDVSFFSGAGETITYTYTIKNNGEETLVGPFAILDSNLTVEVVETATLAPGASIITTKEYVTTELDVANTSIINLAFAYGYNTISSTVAAEVNYDSDPEPEPEPDIDVTGSGGYGLSGNADVILIADPSGIYALVVDKTCDTLYDRSGVTYQDVKIPDPFVKTGFIDGNS